MDRLEESLKSYYTQELGSGLSKVFTPKEVRDKMIIHAVANMKILVLFNFEFCYDLWKKGCKDVTFASDDELKNRIVETTWGFKTELVEPRSINKKFEGMKFDLIISNPPYGKNLHTDILQDIISLTDAACFVHPMTWLYNNKESKKDLKLKNKLKDSFVSVEVINANEVFGIAQFIDCGITFFNKNSKNKSDIFSIDLHGDSDIYRSIKMKILSYCKHSNVHNKALCLTEKYFNHDYPFEVGFNFMRGHGPADMYTTIQWQNEKKHYGTTTNYPIKFGFTNEIEMLNFKNYLKNKFTRFCLSIYKIGRNVHQGELASVPWLDFSRSWSDEECAKELGITDEELLWAIKWIYDCYPEDAEIYRKLEEKLMNKR
jgi:hypothetical protein